MDTSKIISLLGDKSDYYLNHVCKTIDKSLLHLPSPTCVDDVWVNSDRNIQTLNSLQTLLGHGRLANTGYVSILPVDQDIEHTAGSSFAPNPIYFDPENIVKLAIEGGCNAVASTFGILGSVARKYAHKIPFLVKLNHNELLTYPNSYNQILFGTVKEAWNMGAVAVGATIYFGSEQSRRQLVEIADAFEYAHELGMATVLWCYLRNSSFKKDGIDYSAAADLTGQANHLGVTIKADIIKQKLPENNGGFTAINFGKIDQKMYTELTTEHPIDLCRYQVANNYMGRVGLINSGLILNLNEPCALETTDWIRPMKYVGIWWGMHLGVESWVINDRHGATTENAKRYIDFAAANNIEAVMYEGWNEGWENWGGSQTFDYTRPYADFDIEEIARYAREKGVAIIGHHETGGNIINYEKQLDKSYKWYADLGIHSVKTGYAGGLPDGHNHHGQYNVRHYRNVVETAAKYHTTLDVHEPIKDTGIRRTYPNMMTREGARGMEWNAWSEGNPPEHHVMLPFTRLLAGPMDYTPSIFDIMYERAKNSPYRKQWNMKDSKDCRINSTLAKQIANWVILYSPLQMAADMIENYEGHPAFQFFRDFDADCDWSEALAGEPGEFVVIVRRAGEKYFLGAATNEEAREVTVALDFLEKDKTYRAVIYADGKDADWVTNPTAYEIIEKQVTATDILSVNMAKGGGQAITFMPL